MMSSSSAPADTDRLKDSPHLLQAEAKGCPRSHAGLPRVLAADAKSVPYRRRRGELKSVLHWGQRKLLMSEIEFLTNFAEGSSKILVYAGAAPGTHVAYLSELFPDMTFVLVDPNDFTVRRTAKIIVRQEFFTDKTALEFANKGVLFVSDIRTANPSKMSEQEVEQRVRIDMDAQMKWHEIMKPHRSMLKFRLPWANGKTKYLDGDIYLPIWGPQTTSESRLVPYSQETKDWDNRLYEGQMFNFNTCTRETWYEHNVKDGEGLDHCFDCASEIFVLVNYLRSRRVPVAESASSSSASSGIFVPTAHKAGECMVKEQLLNLTKEERSKVKDMSYDISRMLSRGRRTLAMKQPPPDHRHLQERETPLDRLLPSLDKAEHFVGGKQPLACNTDNSKRKRKFEQL